MAPATLLPETDWICASWTHPMQLLDSVSALAALSVRMAYGVELICCRGLSVVKLPVPAGRTAMSRKRSAPGNADAPKSSCTGKTPFVTVTADLVSVPPIWVPLAAASKSPKVRSYEPSGSVPPLLSSP